MSVIEPGVEQRYTAFGLTISSELPLPELIGMEDEAEIDVRVVRNTVPVEETVHTHAPGVIVDDDNEITLLYEACTVSVRNGEQIVVDPAPDAAERDVRWVVLGAAFNFLLHQRGHFVLHASAVGINGAAVAFVGDSGTGKSTTAAAFVDAGHRLLSDDVAGVDLSGPVPTVRGGFPAIKLRDPVASRFKRRLSPISSPEPTECAADDEQFHRVDEGGSVELPLRAVYLLEEGDQLRVTRIDSTTAVATLAQHAYTVGMHGRRDEATLALDHASKLAETVPVSMLQRPQTFDVLSDVIDLVEEEHQ